MFSDDGVGLMHNFVIGGEWGKGYGYFLGTPVWREMVCAASWQQRKNPTVALNSPITAANSSLRTGAIIAVLSPPSGIKFMDLSFLIKAALKYSAWADFSVRPIALTALLHVQNGWDLCWLFALTSLSAKHRVPHHSRVCCPNAWRRDTWVALSPEVLSSMRFPGVVQVWNLKRRAGGQLGTYLARIKKGFDFPINIISGSLKQDYIWPGNFSQSSAAGRKQILDIKFLFSSHRIDHRFPK